MPIPHAVLAVLARRPQHGYALRAALADELGADWRVDFGSLYRTLAQLHRRGWVVARVQRGRGGPDRKVYAITRAGRAELRQWLREPAGPARGREALPVKLRFGAAAAPLVIAGSDDPLLDLLTGLLASKSAAHPFATHPVGSLAGLLALRDGRAHLAGIHLLDPDSGEYNAPFVKHLLPEEPIVLVQLARREQGLMLPAGNPRGIRALRDLTRRGVRIVNRQKGAGTRLLLYHQLRQVRIDPHAIRGYARELPTHDAVAAAIAAGQADAGPGLRAVATARGLDFLPLGEERYDLAIPERLFASRRLRPLLECLHGTPFRRAAAAFAGYDLTRMGAVVATLR